jgi:predicted ATPase/class 3 adenylate cyclase
VAAPSGTLTFLFTDIEGSTRLWEERPDDMPLALALHDRMVREAVAVHGGHVFATGGDGFAAAFGRAADAVGAAVDAQQAIGAEPWPDDLQLRVRMGVHSGEVSERDGDYFGPAVNTAARLMSAAHGGQLLCSAATAALLDDAGLVDLGEHRLRDLQRPLRVFQVGDGAFPPLRSLDVLPGNLPVQLTTFIGREAELADVADALVVSRLVTLTGVGGVGKTRLALQVAAEVVPRFGDGAWLVELAAASDDDAVVHVIAAALGVTPRPGLSMGESVRDYLRGRQLLVVIDNCEHVLSTAARLVEDILRDCRGVRVLATSREGLAVRGEQLWPVRSLEVPNDETLASAASVRLFVDRARLVVPAFAPGGDGLAAIGEICRRLDGIPLALELAASRVGSMSPQEIASLLGERFRLLGGGRRAAVERHQTLRAALEWSYELLSAEERAVFARLGVFSGGFDAAAAIEVAGDGTLDGWAVRDALASLVAKSLLSAADSPSGATRYDLLETLRAFALEQLRRDSDPDVFRRRHADHYAAFANEAAWQRRGPDEVAWARRARSELDNLRAAVSWALESPGDEQLAVEIIGALADVAINEPALGIGGWAAAAVGAARSAATGKRAVVLAVAAFHRQASWETDAGGLAEEAAASGVPPDCPSPSLVYIPLAAQASLEGRADDAMQIALAAVDEVEALYSDPYTRCGAHAIAAAFATSADELDVAARHAEQAVALARETCNPSRLALALSHLGWVRTRADPPNALDPIKEAVELVERGATLSALPQTLEALAWLYLGRGELPDAARTILRSLCDARDRGIRLFFISGLHSAIAIVDALGHARPAATLLGAVRSPAIARYTVSRMVTRPDLGAVEVHVRTTLGETYERVYAQGVSMDYDTAVGFAIDELQRIVAML